MKLLDDIPCDYKRDILCKIQAKPNGSISTTIRPEIKINNHRCHAEWHKIQSHCYIVSKERIKGSNAPAFCPNRYTGSHLAKIESYNDFTELQKLLSLKYPSNEGILVN